MVYPASAPELQKVLAPHEAITLVDANATPIAMRIPPSTFRAAVSVGLTVPPTDGSLFRLAPVQVAQRNCS